PSVEIWLFARLGNGIGAKCSRAMPSNSLRRSSHPRSTSYSRRHRTGGCAHTGSMQAVRFCRPGSLLGATRTALPHTTGTNRKVVYWGSSRFRDGMSVTWLSSLTELAECSKIGEVSGLTSATPISLDGAAFATEGDRVLSPIEV